MILKLWPCQVFKNCKLQFGLQHIDIQTCSTAAKTVSAKLCIIGVIVSHSSSTIQSEQLGQPRPRPDDVQPLQLRAPGHGRPRPAGGGPLLAVGHHRRAGVDPRDQNRYVYCEGLNSHQYFYWNLMPRHIVHGGSHFLFWNEYMKCIKANSDWKVWTWWFVTGL